MHILNYLQQQISAQVVYDFLLHHNNILCLSWAYGFIVDW